MSDTGYPKVSSSGATSVPANPRFPQIEEAVLAYWKDDDTFRASVEQRDPGENGEGEFVFYDGPPFANGLPHYGHLLTGYVKDVVPRFQTMRGKRVERRFGWDTHGLPAELEAMRLAGIKTTDEIVEMGIDKFNDACRESVLKYTGEWQEYVTRQARWVDFENDYRTMNPEFMESVIWAFKQLYDKGLIYEGFRVLPYCWNDETPLSNHELRMDDDVYKQRQDPAVTVGVRLNTGEIALIWTTTPWTLPSNLAIMVGGDLEYVVVESSFTGTPERYIIGAERLDAYSRELKDKHHETVHDQVVQRLKGSELVGRTYTPMFNYYLGHENAFRLVDAEFVTTTDGTGLVHTAGAFGEDDKVVTDRENIEAVMPVGKDGRFTYPVTDYEGMLVFDANAHVIDHLKAATRNLRAAPLVEEGARTADPLVEEGAKTGDPLVEEGEERARLETNGGFETLAGARSSTTKGGAEDQGSVTDGTVLLRRESYEHSYPHCWRCREPLIYKGVSSWFVEVTAFKQRMLELNQQINWVPNHIKDGQFGKWLENARDWSITRNRFWGSPVPVWKSDDPTYPRIDVYGSFEEFERDFGELPRNAAGEPDLHRPWVDNLTRPNPDDPTGKSVMRRVTDVLDVWFDSGSMSFAQVHYPFEHKDWFDGVIDADGVRRGGHFPGDFIVEYIGQTRGWFYTMHILASALFDKPAFSNCVSHGIVLGSDGNKMSKSLRNYPDVSEVFDRDGADAMRWFLMSSPILRGGNLIVTEQGIRDSVRQVMIPLWNSWYFFSLYANAAGYDARSVIGREGETSNPLDRYLLAKTAEFAVTSAEQHEAFEVAAACDSMRAYLDVLTNWYIRRSRERFWAADGDLTDDNRAAFDTLYTVLEVVTRVCAPLLPLVTEEIWRGLTGGRSVHLTDWPDGELPEDHALVEVMDTVRDVCSAGSALRKAANLRTRLPLSKLTVISEGVDLTGFEDLIADELNLKQVVLLAAHSSEADRYHVEQKLTVNARAAGPRLGKDVQVAIKASKTGDWSIAEDGSVTAGGLALEEGEYTLETVAASGGNEATGLLPHGGFVVLDTEVTPELAQEGLARDLVRGIQQARKEAGLDVSDRIVLTVDGDDAVLAAARVHESLVAGETLATTYTLGEPTPGAFQTEVTVGDNAKAVVSVQRV